LDLRENKPFLLFKLSSGFKSYDHHCLDISTADR
jgi:hypothetical protein